MKKRILFIHHGSVLGGAPVSLKNMVNGLNTINDDYDFNIFCVNDAIREFFKGIPGVGVFKYAKIPLFIGRILIGWSRLSSITHFKLFLKDLLLLKSAIRNEIQLLKKMRPDLVHLNSSILLSSALAAKKLKIPIVWHIREASDDSEWNLVRKIYARFIRNTADAVICIGPQEYKKINGDKSNKVKIIYNSLDDSYFKKNDYDIKKFRKQLKLPENGFLFLSLGGDSFRKGPYQLIQSLSRLDQTFSLVLCGKSPKIIYNKCSLIKSTILKFEEVMFNFGLKRTLSMYYRHRLSEAMKRMNNERIINTGIIEDVKPYIKACDVLVFAGTTPHSARPVYEAWALKKPVVVFDSEVMRHDVQDGIDGIIVRRHTPEALAEALIYLRKNPEVAKKMAENGYTKVMQRFSIERNSIEISKIYQEILNEYSV